MIAEQQSDEDRKRALRDSDYHSYWDDTRSHWSVMSYYGKVASGFKTQRDADDYILDEILGD